MSRIELETRIAAPRERVFDLARSVEAHVASTDKTEERVVAGRSSGLFEAGEVVTWEARHFGLRQRLTVKITAVDRPASFEDEMVQGAFASMRHRHEFIEQAGITLMRDSFEFAAPFGLLGRIAEVLVLKRYLKYFLLQRNAELKAMAEGNDWIQILGACAETASD